MEYDTYRHEEFDWANASFRRADCRRERALTSSAKTPRIKILLYSKIILTIQCALSATQSTISRYKTDLNEEITDSLSKLHQLFETVLENTDAQSDKAIKTLAGALAKVSEQMIDNYKTLVAKIKEVDELLIERRRLR